MKIVQRIKLVDFHSKSSLNVNSVSELDVKKEILNFLPKKLPEKVIFQPRYYKTALTLTIKADSCY